ncbi:carboxypeptidase regulatory-like domain-containing protein, partial [Singulisphaera rosea]
RFVGLGAIAAGTEALDAPLPAITPGKLAEAIREAQKAYSAVLIEAEFDDLHDRDFTGQGAPDIDKFSGRFQYIGEGRRWRVEYDSMMPSSGPRRLIADRWTSGFDGEGHYLWNVRSNEVTLGSSEISATTLVPKALFWPEGTYLEQMLAEPGMDVGQTTVDGARCYVVKQESMVDGAEWRTEFWVSPRQGHLLAGVTLARNGRVYATYRLGDFREVGRGRWVPHRIVRESLSLKKDGTSRLSLRREARIARFEADRTFAPADFQLRMPLNVFVNDLRLGYAYYNDPWWPEIGKLLLGHYDWPRTDLTPLQQVASHGGEAVEGKEAPPVEAARWINEGPVDLERLRGKVVLLNFTALAANRDAVPSLRKLAETYKTAGLEVVTILGSQDDPDDAREYVRELGIKGPVAIDLPHKKSLGATRAAFGMKGEVSTFLVDHSGDVHRIVPGSVVETVVRLLGEAGARNVKSLYAVQAESPLGKADGLNKEPEIRQNPATHAEFTQAMADSINRFWPGWREKADKTGKLVGAVVDGQGKPVLGARVKVTPITYVAPFGNSRQGFNTKPCPIVASGPDGRYVIPDLCKGNYVLDVTAPGLAAVERMAVILPTPGETSLAIVMGQADSIVGRLRNKEGRPLAGASVSISDRHIPHPDGTTTYHNGFLEMKLTDAEGRFRFGGLPEGAYSVEAKADGLAGETRRDVQAGTGDLEFTLGKSDTPH